MSYVQDDEGDTDMREIELALGFCHCSAIEDE